MCEFFNNLVTTHTQRTRPQSLDGNVSRYVCHLFTSSVICQMENRFNRLNTSSILPNSIIYSFSEFVVIFMCLSVCVRIYSLNAILFVHILWQMIYWNFKAWQRFSSEMIDLIATTRQHSIATQKKTNINFWGKFF